MASYFNPFNQARDSHDGRVFRRGTSTSQASLVKILRVISTFRPGGTDEKQCLGARFVDASRLKDEKGSLCCGGRGFGVDLKLRLGSSADKGDSGVLGVGDGQSVCSPVGGSGVREVAAVGEMSSEGERNLEQAGELYRGESPAAEGNRSEAKIKPTEDDNDGNEEREEEQDREHREKEAAEGESELGTKPSRSSECRSEGYLGMLIEAATLISGDFADAETEPGPENPSWRGALSCELRTDKIAGPTRTGSKRDHRWMVDLYGDLEDISPVVRSKRGRSQVLPYRYRDSVLEPLKPLPRYKSNTVSAKRRSR